MNKNIMIIHTISLSVEKLTDEKETVTYSGRIYKTDGNNYYFTTTSLLKYRLHYDAVLFNAVNRTSDWQLIAEDIADESILDKVNHIENMLLLPKILG